MCGIVAYIGSQEEAYPILLNGLKRLEYRGYDSSGMALLQDGKTTIHKKKGKVNKLEKYCVGKNMTGNVGITHTRWATHGEPNDANVHPHTSMRKLFTIVHNGIIENYEKLKKDLIAKDYVFTVILIPKCWLILLNTCICRKRF